MILLPFIFHSHIALPGQKLWSLWIISRVVTEGLVGLDLEAPAMVNVEKSREELEGGCYCKNEVGSTYRNLEQSGAEKEQEVAILDLDRPRGTHDNYTTNGKRMRMSKCDVRRNNLYGNTLRNYDTGNNITVMKSSTFAPSFLLTFVPLALD